MKIQHLIDGESVASADYFETINPATQEVLAEVARGGAKEVDAAVAAGTEVVVVAIDGSLSRRLGSAATSVVLLPAA